jgi:hypothetical protein|tara:strand:- start:315 stop:716 length:402 start_codon:yes stop_codon:yes gene_type:complete
MKNTSIDLPSNKRFGFFFAVIFFISALSSFYNNAQILSIVLGVIGLLFFATSLIKDSLLLPLNKLWMHFGKLLGMIVSPLVLAILFFFIFTPIAIGMRIFNRDELRLKPLDSSSFWKVRDQDSLSPRSFNQQF